MNALIAFLMAVTDFRNATGPRPALFVPEVSFELLVRTKIFFIESIKHQLLYKLCYTNIQFRSNVKFVD